MKRVAIARAVVSLITGFAHLFEHLMFQKSKPIPEDSFFRFHGNNRVLQSRTTLYSRREAST
jgi:predicted Zn-dependent peptidase